MAEYLARYPFDFLVGSVHWIGGWGYDRRGVEYEYDRRGTRRAYEDYFALELALAASGIVDILAHVDAIKKPARFLDELPIELYQPVVEAAATSGTAVRDQHRGMVASCRGGLSSPDISEDVPRRRGGDHDWFRCALPARHIEGVRPGRRGGEEGRIRASAPVSRSRGDDRAPTVLVTMTGSL